MRRTILLAAPSLLLFACAPSGPEPLKADGPVGRMIVEAAEKHAVPADLMVAVAHVEGGLFLAARREAHDDEAVPIAGVLELRHGRFDSLAAGAALSGHSQRELIEDLALGTDAGARVLDDLARDRGLNRGDTSAWAEAIEELSGHLFAQDREAYRAEVFKILRRGGVIKARGGETIELPPHPEIPLGMTISPPGVEPAGTPDYPGAVWLETPQFAATTCDGTQAQKYDTDRGGFPVTMIAIHDTEGGWNASVATLQNDPCKSVHYIVDADGSRVAQFIPETYTGWHAGNYWYNQHMVGIEHVGFAGKDEYQTAMYKASADLVKNIASRHGLALDRKTLVGHQEVPDPYDITNSSPPCADSPGDCISNTNYGGAGHHTDPGIYWEWCQYMELVGGTCKCNDAYSLWNCVHDGTMMVRCPAGEVEIVHCADVCVVEPIGVNDHCTEVMTTGSGSTSGSGGAGGTGGAGGSPAAGVGGAGGGGGMGGSTGSWGEGGSITTGNGGSKGSPGEEASCSVGNVGEKSGAAGFVAALVIGVMGASRRRRR